MRLRMLQARMAKKIPLALKFEPDLLKRLDRFVSSRPFQTTRTNIIEVAVQRLLDQEEAGEKREAKRK
jgi:metal-responsive CopG/Arc/MetJ family transcriptional regulator